MTGVRFFNFMLLVSIIVVLVLPACVSAQDSLWTQKLDGWVDNAYYPYLFIGGNYLTRISFADIDNDGDLDLFYGGGDSGSLVYFENVGNVHNPVFEFRYEEFSGLTTIEVHRYGGAVDADFADIDNDGDLDAAFSRNLDAGGMIFWNDGSPEAAQFTYRSPYGPLSGASSVTLVDIDNDGDYDYFSGHGDYPHQLIFARNYGTPELPYFNPGGDTHNYQDLQIGQPFNFDMGDIDNDGDYDMIVCRRLGPVNYYENTGAPDSAYFTLVNEDFLPGRDTTDWTESPELVDIDGDGDLDLFLAGAYAHLYYFENIGTPEAYDYIQRYDTTFFFVQAYSSGGRLKNAVDIDGDGDDDLAPGHDLFLNESIGAEIRFIKYANMLPFVVGCFADMDADGDYDYLAPAGQHTIIYFENIGDETWPQWADGYSLFPYDGRIETPFTVGAGDLDNDGDIDLLIGHTNSTGVNYYRNDGTPQAGEFEYAGLLQLPQWEYQAYYNLLLDDIDNDADLDLLIGDTSTDYDHPKKLFFYRNDGTLDEPVWTYITDDFQEESSAHRNTTIIPCLADVDRDGDKDLVVTNNSVGFQLFLNPTIQTEIKNIVISEPDETSIMRAYPNPSNAIFLLKVTLEKSAYVSLTIFDLLGRRTGQLYSGVASAGENVYTWDSSQHASGIYFYRLQAGGDSYRGRMVLLK